MNKTLTATPNLLKFVRKYYKCPTLEGMQQENEVF